MSAAQRQEQLQSVPQSVYNSWQAAGRGKIVTRAVGVVLGSFIFRLVYTIALRFHLPAFMLKLVSSIIVVIAMSFPYLKTQLPMMKRRLTHSKNNR